AALPRRIGTLAVHGENSLNRGLGPCNPSAILPLGVPRMAGSANLPRTWRTPLSIALLAMAAASAPLHAQTCAGKLGEKSSDSLERFSMINAQCGSLAVPLTVHRAAQLDLYDKPVVAVTTAPAPAASAPAVSAPVPPLAAPALDVPTTPPTR